MAVAQRPDVQPLSWTPLRRSLADLLIGAREQTLALIAPLSDADLELQHDPLMSPVLWDLGHIAHFEELWLTRNLDGPIEFGEMPGIFNPFENPRRTRGELPLPRRQETLAVLAEIREGTLARLEDVDFERNALLRDGFVYRMVAQHEFQHGETILQTLQLKLGEPYHAPRRAPVPQGRRPATPGAMVRFPGGEVALGTDDRSTAYDNERPRHRVALAPFWIDVTAVTNGEYEAFVAAGGYERRDLWSAAGWTWKTEQAVTAPQFWTWLDGEWWTRSMDRTMRLDPFKPVCHVSYHEAEAYARWAGKRLPTEQEWEAAASWDPETGAQRSYPWGEAPPTPDVANVDQIVFEAAPVGAYPANVSPIGCYGMIGDVWEWTSSGFHPWPGFESFPYREYSEVFFGDEYKVLRGGSWATRAGAVRNTFRNWDYPIRRQIFSGFRCARDA